MSSSVENANNPRIPGLCDICEKKDGRFGMNFLQCSKCKVCFHRECHMVFPENDGKEFICYACEAVGRTFQAVDTHMSNNFYEIEQKKRPVECALCNVSTGIHAMFPLYDYHGKGGRQICYTKKVKDRNGKTKHKRVLAWAHALCAVVLSQKGFLYACNKEGDYGAEEDEEDESAVDVTVLRVVNPELKITKQFERMYGSGAISHYRYYMEPPNGPIDFYTKIVLDHKRDTHCIVCGSDDRKNMRIPMQCVANDDTEHADFKVKHRKIDHRDIEPCTQALHVGCARWGNPSCGFKQVFYFPGIDHEGSLLADKNTVACVYCTKHAQNVSKRKQKYAGQERVDKDKHRMSNSLPFSSSSHPSTGAPIMKGMKSKPMIAARSPLVAVPGETKLSGRSFESNRDQPKEVDSSASAISNDSGQQPKPAKRQRQTANDRSIPSKHDVRLIFDDLVNHQDEISRDQKSAIRSRKIHWKHEFSTFPYEDFKSIWLEAKKQYFEHQGDKNRNHDKIQASSDDVAASTASSIDFTDISTQKSDTELKGERPPDRWSKLFIGYQYKIGYEFTLDDFENA